MAAGGHVEVHEKRHSRIGNSVLLFGFYVLFCFLAAFTITWSSCVCLLHAHTYDILHRVTANMSACCCAALTSDGQHPSVHPAASSQLLQTIFFSPLSFKLTHKWCFASFRTIRRWLPAAVDVMDVKKKEVGPQRNKRSLRYFSSSLPVLLHSSFCSHPPEALRLKFLSFDCYSLRCENSRWTGPQRKFT